MLFVKKIIDFLLKQIYVNETIIIYECQKIKEQSSNAQIRRVTFENVNDALSFQDKRFISQFEKFMKQCDEGYFGYVGGRCVHRSWVKANNQTVYMHWSLPYTLKDGEILIHYCETAKEARGQNVFPHVLCHVSNEYKDKKILIAVNNKNISSIKSIEKAGFTHIKTISILILLGLRFQGPLKL